MVESAQRRDTVLQDVLVEGDAHDRMAPVGSVDPAVSLKVSIDVSKAAWFSR